MIKIDVDSPITTTSAIYYPASHFWSVVLKYSNVSVLHTCDGALRHVIEYPLNKTKWYLKPSMFKVFF